MKSTTMLETMNEARRFIKACTEAKQMLTGNDWDYAKIGIGNKYTAAVKRASMDLSRKLADLRMGR